VPYHTFGDSSINFIVWSGLTVKHEFIRRLHGAHRRAGISMPFPTRTLELTPLELGDPDLIET
jgi:small-conductance mechanosensitive channel